MRTLGTGNIKDVTLRLVEWVFFTFLAVSAVLIHHFVISISLLALLVIYNYKSDLSVSVLFHISLLFFFSSRDGSQSKLLKFSLGQKKTSRSAPSAFRFSCSSSTSSFLHHTSCPVPFLEIGR